MKQIENVEIMGNSPKINIKTQIRKASKLNIERKYGALEYIEPRFEFDQLITLLEINTWHRRCVSLKAACAVGFGAFITDVNGVAIEKDKEPTDEAYKQLKTLINQPNPKMRFSAFANRLMIDYLSCGNCFAEIERNKKGEPAVINHARAKTMRLGKDLKFYYQVLNDAKSVVTKFAVFGEQKEEDQNEIICLSHYDPRSDYYGVPEWIASLGAQLLDRSAAEFNIRMFENDLMLKWLIFLIGAALSPDAKTTLKSFFDNNYTGIKNAGRAAVVPIEGGENVKVEAKNLMGDGLNRDASYTKMREQVRDEIIAAHGVPPRLVGIIAAGQLGGGGELEAQLHMFKATVIDPLRQEFEDFLNQIPIVAGWNYRIQFKEMDITTASTDRSFWAAIPGLVMSEVLTADEGRDLMEMAPGAVQKSMSGAKIANLARELIALRKAMIDEDK